jgi:hypothetical protein
LGLVAPFQKQQAKNLESRTKICGPPSGSTFRPA